MSQDVVICGVCRGAIGLTEREGVMFGYRVCPGHTTIKETLIAACSALRINIVRDRDDRYDKAAALRAAHEAQAWVEKNVKE